MKLKSIKIKKINFCSCNKSLRVCWISCYTIDKEPYSGDYCSFVSVSLIKTLFHPFKTLINVINNTYKSGQLLEKSPEKRKDLSKPRKIK